MILDVEVTPAAAVALDEDVVERGRRLVWRAVVALVLADLLANLIVVTVLGVDRLPAAAFRLFTGVLSASFVVRGNRYARWLTVALVALGMFIWIPLIGATLSRGLLVFAGFFIVIAATLLASGVTLARNPVVDAFFRHRASTNASDILSTGRSHIVLAFGLLLSIVAWAVIVALAEGAPERVPRNLFIGALVAALCLLVLRGHGWARRLTLGIGIPLTIFMVGVLLTAFGRALAIGPMSFVVACMVVSMAILLGSRAVHAYMRHHSKPELTDAA